MILLAYNKIWLDMQSHERQNFLSLKYESHKGLTLFWNFKDLTAAQRYFRHIFVITTEKTYQVFPILETLYKRMKYGDLFCCIYANDAYIYKVGKWIQKSQLSNFKPERYFKELSNRTLDQTSKSKMIDAAGKEALEFNEPVVINFLGVGKKEGDFYKNEIQRHRSALMPTYEYIANLFGPFQISDVSVHLGINYLKTNVQDFVDMADFYHRLINGAAVHSAYVQITAMNGQFTLFNDYHWKNPDFRTIAADYYGPSSRFWYQKLSFFNKDPNAFVEHEFQIKLRIKLFGNKILENIKRVKINFLLEQDYCPTFQNVRGRNVLNNQKNIELIQDPNVCLLVVKYSSIREDSAKI